MPRYFFVLPDAARPVGGVNVALQFIEALRGAGYEAAPLYSRPDFKYAFYNTSCPGYYYPPLASVPRKFAGRERNIKESLYNLIRPTGAKLNTALEPRADDVFVLPEMWYPEYSNVFQGHRRVLLAQDVYWFCFAYRRDLKNAAPAINRFDFTISTSEASQAAVETISGLSSSRVPLTVSRPSLNASTQKRRQIAYMPRKRGEQVEIVVNCLRAMPEFVGWDFVKIDKVSPERLDEIFRESLIFLSFSHQEGFGLPPAEAMAAGCIVAGYTGVGGEEYFTSDYGFPIPDGDMVKFISTVKSIVQEYSQDPSRLDEMRMRASEHIHSRYSLESMKAALLPTWAKLDALVSGR